MKFFSCSFVVEDNMITGSFKALECGVMIPFNSRDCKSCILLGVNGDLEDNIHLSNVKILDVFGLVTASDLIRCFTSMPCLSLSDLNGFKFTFGGC